MNNQFAFFIKMGKNLAVVDPPERVALFMPIRAVKKETTYDLDTITCR